MTNLLPQHSQLVLEHCHIRLDHPIITCPGISPSACFLECCTAVVSTDKAWNAETRQLCAKCWQRRHLRCVLFLRAGKQHSVDRDTGPSHPCKQVAERWRLHSSKRQALCERWQTFCSSGSKQ